MYELLVHVYYEYLMIVVILLNTAWMCTDHYPKEPLYLVITPMVENVFLVIYMVDLSLKSYAYGLLKVDSNNRWPVADFWKSVGLYEMCEPRPLPPPPPVPAP